MNGQSPGHLLPQSEVRPLREAETLAVCALFANVYGHTISPAQWAWKYRQGPRLAGINLVLASPEGELLGHIGGSVFPGMFQGRSIAMAQVGDIMLRREVRGSMGREGTYRRLVSAMQDALARYQPALYAYGFPGERPFRLGEKIGFYRRLYSCQACTIGPQEACTHQRLGVSVSVANIHAQDVRNKLDQLWRRHGPHLPESTLQKDGAYLGWRYASRPQSNGYRLYWVRRLGFKLGWLVVADAPAGPCVVDSLLPPGCAGMALAALQRHASLPVTGWIVVPHAPTENTPIVAGELEIGGAYTGWAAPRFQPGDTDVY